MRSTDACPPPVISNARAIPRNATASSMPGGAKKAGHRTTIAVIITQIISNAPRRVSNPSRTNIPPRSSEIAAAPSHSDAGRMNGSGAYWAGIDIHFAQPGPLNEPRTFCAPCPMKAIPRASRSGTVAHEAEVDVSLRSIDFTLSESHELFCAHSTINPFAARHLGKKLWPDGKSLTARSKRDISQALDLFWIALPHFLFLRGCALHVDALRAVTGD